LIKILNRIWAFIDGPMVGLFVGKSPGSGPFIVEYLLASEHDRLMAELRAENDRLREALQPFAAIPDPRNPNGPHNDSPVWGRNGVTLTVGDFAKARAALGES